MTDLDELKKLRCDWLRDLFESYGKLEAWGVSLFLGALGLVARQLIEWDEATDVPEHVTLPPEVVYLPALMGLTAFLFLRIVNFRAHEVGEKLEKLTTLAGASQQRTFPLFGFLGVILALMPVVLGFAVSWYLALGHYDRQVILRPLWCGGEAFVVVVLVIHVIMRIREWLKARGQMPNPPIQPTGSTGG